MVPVVCLEYLSYQECYNTPPLQTYTKECDNFLSAGQWYPYYLSLGDCRYVQPTQCVHNQYSNELIESLMFTQLNRNLMRIFNLVVMRCV